MEKITGILGFKGEPGVSPTITPSKVGGTTTLTIEDVEGTKTATILDGETTNIINSATLSDNTKETYSGAIIDNKLDDKANISDMNIALETKIDASKFAVITSSIKQLTHTGSVDYSSANFFMDWPEGFTPLNSIILDVKSRQYINGQLNRAFIERIPTTWMPSDGSIFNDYVYYDYTGYDGDQPVSNKIYVWMKRPNTDKYLGKTYDIQVVLMKIGD